MRLQINLLPRNHRPSPTRHNPQAELCLFFAEIKARWRLEGPLTRHLAAVARWSTPYENQARFQLTQRELSDASW